MDAVVLIVDDDPTFSEMLKFVLDREGFETKTAFDGAQALQALQHEPVDLVILDVMLPDMDGFEICQRVRRIPSATDVPILMLSARTQVADKLTGFEAGADDYLAKPADPKEIVARIKALLARARRTAASPSRVIAFVGAKGGAGSTTTALNVALALAPQRRVVFFELGPGLSGDWILGLTPPQDLLGIASGDGFRLSGAALRSCITSHHSGLDYLAGTGSPVCAAKFGPGVIADTLALLQQEYETIVVDVSTSDPSALEETLTHAGIIVPVSEHDTLSTRRLIALLGWLQGARLAAKAPGFVLVDRFSGASKESPSAISSQVGLGVLEIIPAAPDALYYAHGRQEPLYCADPEHPASQAYAALAHRLSADSIEIEPSLRP